ncbi:hypothetical protein M5X17_27635 [Paenibacillus alvei]|uniref:hypothetical protein n=1 Tax=Paenibacillus alvei TaxID=44250 RepID=UPI00228228FA|nr:hypothetical protein [Paenibacillus alvei]MCY9737478.1 hypothetical protein [Paenibacillus alvei]
MEELELIPITVGQKFTLFDNVDNLIGKDVGLFEALSHEQGYVYIINYTNISQGEYSAVKSKKISVNIYKDDSGFVLPLMRFGNSNLIFEFVFDPTLYKDARSLQFTENNNIMSIFLIEGTNGNVLHIRQVNLPLKMIQICKEAWSRAILDVDFSVKYSNWYENIKQKHSLETLWDRATYIGKMGEMYDVNEIKCPYIPEKRTE